MILFRMGRSICSGLIDRGLNIIDTLETSGIRPVKPLIFQFSCGEYRWTQSTRGYSARAGEDRSGSCHSHGASRRSRARTDGPCCQLTTLWPLHHGACWLTQFGCKSNSSRWIIPLISKTDYTRGAAQSKFWLFCLGRIRIDICPKSRRESCWSH